MVLTQNPAGLPPRVGSIPTSGTNYPQIETTENFPDLSYILSIFPALFCAHGRTNSSISNSLKG